MQEELYVTFALFLFIIMKQNFNHVKQQVLSITIYNLGGNILDKLTKLSKIEFCLECFTSDFLQFSDATVKI